MSPTLNNKEVSISKTIQGPLGVIWMVHGLDIIEFDGYEYSLINARNIFSSLKKNDFISDIVTDQKRNIWIITNFGLVSRYNNGNSKFEDITPMLHGHTVNHILARENAIWLSTKEGSVYRYADSKIDSITTLNNTSYSPQKINDIEIGKNNELYISTEEGKLYSYSINTELLDEIVGPFTDFPGNLILTIDKSNRLWIGTETYGLFVYDISSKDFIQDSFFDKKRFNINKEMFLTLLCDSKGNIWGGTDGGGLYKINSNTGDIDLFTSQYSNEFSLSSNTILDINEDLHKNIWITTNYGKLNILPSINNNISYHEGSENFGPLRVLSLYKSSKDVIWVGTDGHGLTKITHNSDGSTNETQYFNDISLNKGFYVQSITEDNLSNIWFGTYKNGVWVHNTHKNTFKKIKVFNSKHHEATDVRTVYKDSKGRIWIGSNISINIYSQDFKLLATFENKSHGLMGSIVESIIEDENKIIWLGLYGGGLFRFNENLINIEESTFTNYPYANVNDKNEIYSIKSMVLGSQNEIWLINNHGRLLKFNTKNKVFTTFEDIKSINEQGFSAVLKEDNNNLWMSSNNGICHLNIKDKILKTFYTTDGFQDNMFMPRSAFKDHDDILYFGSAKGLNYFNPKHLSKKTSNATLHINDIEVLNQPASKLLSSQITSGIPNVKSLNLKYNQSSFSFKFSAVDNILNPNFYYAYKLKGFDEKWITSRLGRIATYTNIPYGNYTFEVKAGTKNGVWNIPAKQIAINIEPPIWRNPIAYFLYLCILGFIAYGIRHWYLLRKKLFLEKVSHKKESELHALKMNFFAKMSHEIQTPLTLILGPIDDMLKKSEQNGNLLLRQRLNIIAYNTKRLSRIARELTLVRNKELNKLKLNITKNDFCKNIEEITLSFKELARKKQIDFAVNCPKNLSKTWYDKEKIEHVIYNLLSNAFKFTPREGNIQLNAVPVNSKKMIKLSITDSGPGITREELNNIFELFYQSNIGKKSKGTGIGLALTKELIDLHRGKIEVNSSPIDGTVFTITIPVNENAYYESELIFKDDYEETDVANEINENSTLQKGIDVSKKTILIVEDNYDLQSFLKDLLHEYNIILAENGEEGYYYAKSNFPDLILSDIMMPKLDGIEMCKKLQEDHLTKHIPVILLTAKNSTNSKISGLKSGAIEYINKPFNSNELLLKVKNIIVSREHIISKYRKEIISHPEVKLEKSKDEIFLENLVSNINLRLEDANFKMEELADSLNMSYSSLYRKCQSLTGHNLVDFVRLIRLKKAAILIVKYGYNVSGASFATGFNDPKYFSKCFKKQFKITPKEFKNSALSKKNIEKYLEQNNINILHYDKV